MNDRSSQHEPERIRIDAGDLLRANAGDLPRANAAAPATRVTVDARALPPAPPLESPATRRGDRRNLLIAALLLGVLMLVIGVFGGGIVLARAITKPSPAQGGLSVRVPSDGEKRAIGKGDLRLVAPSVEGRSGGILGAEWGGSAIPWRMTADGRLLLVTNAHVAEGPGGGVGALEIVFASGERRKVTAVGVAEHEGCDLAILAVESEGLSEGSDYRLLSPQPPEDWTSLAAGDEVVAVGTPLGYPQTQTFGRISALREAMPEFRSQGVRWVQVDATVLPGNSGGPLLRLAKGSDGKEQWRWVGVITAKGVTGIGFAIHAGEVTAKSFRWVLGKAPVLSKDGKAADEAGAESKDEGAVSDGG
jgi:hypothetical protein